MVHVRSVPAQKKPYPLLLEIANNQPEFTHENIKGTLIGYRIPNYFAAFNLPGYHVHFVDEKKTVGGHVFALKIKSGRVTLAESSRYTFHIPSNVESFRKADCDADKSKETKIIEGGN